MYRKPRVETLTVANSGTTTSAVQMRDYLIAGIVLPAALTSTAITIHVCDTESGTYVAAYDSDSNAVSLTVAASRWVGLSGAEADAVAGAPWIKLVCGSSEGAERTIKLCLK